MTYSALILILFNYIFLKFIVNSLSLSINYRSIYLKLYYYPVTHKFTVLILLISIYIIVFNKINYSIMEDNEVLRMRINSTFDLSKRDHHDVHQAARASVCNHFPSSYIKPTILPLPTAFKSPALLPLPDINPSLPVKHLSVEHINITPRMIWTATHYKNTKEFSPILVDILSNIEKNILFPMPYYIIKHADTINSHSMANIQYLAQYSIFKTLLVHITMFNMMKAQNILTDFPGSIEFNEVCIGLNTRVNNNYASLHYNDDNTYTSFDPTLWIKLYKLYQPHHIKYPPIG